jgi:hypothetical protein
MVVVPISNPLVGYLTSITGKDTYTGFRNHYEDALQFRCSKFFKRHLMNSFRELMVRKESMELLVRFICNIVTICQDFPGLNPGH